MKISAVKIIGSEHAVGVDYSYLFSPLFQYAVFFKLCVFIFAFVESVYENMINYPAFRPVGSNVFFPVYGKLIHLRVIVFVHVAVFGTKQKSIPIQSHFDNAYLGKKFAFVPSFATERHGKNVRDVVAVFKNLQFHVLYVNSVFDKYSESHFSVLLHASERRFAIRVSAVEINQILHPILRYVFIKTVLSSGLKSRMNKTVVLC